MVKAPKFKICVVDEDAQFGSTLSGLLSREGCAPECFTSPRAALAEIEENNYSLVIAALQMAEMDGLELIRAIKAARPGLPVLVITAFANVPRAVQVMRAGAVDLLEKPLDREKLRGLLAKIRDEHEDFAQIRGRKISPTENKILNLVVQGRSNRQTAQQLKLSIRTVEDHRQHLMHKLGARNVVELLRIAARTYNFP